MSVIISVKKNKQELRDSGKKTSIGPHLRSSHVCTQLCANAILSLGRGDWRETLQLSNRALHTLNKQVPEDLQPSACDASFQGFEVAIVQISVLQLKNAR